MQPSFLLRIVSILQLGALTFAHSAGGDIPLPQVFGHASVARHVPRHLIQEVQVDSASHPQKRDTPQKRDEDKKCGPGVGHCSPGECCSPVGFCGTTQAHCASPNCQFLYSNGCDGSKKPLGDSTLNVSRPLIGNVSYDGMGIDHCAKPGTIALTFDDGPYNYTSHLLDVLAAYGAKATFFITGNNLGKGQIDIEETGWPSVIRRMHADGHQIAGHSWGHFNMSSLNETEVTNQIVYLEMALRNILGFIPTYFRPPYDDCTTDVCKSVLKKLGYHITYQNVVNNDWQNDDGMKIEATKEKFLASMRQTNPRDSNYIFLLHDTHYQSSWNLTGYMMDYFELFNFSRSVTVGECMGDPKANWYRAAGGAPDRTLLMKKKSGASTFYSSTMLYSTLLLMCGQFLANVLL
ncbi:glycoside hydrolase/deacetylase [Paraphoma chrysanthemicola]|nr:glycoside hydrolase/deacetylase [Paraphoma chrysanthemicola]